MTNFLSLNWFGFLRPQRPPVIDGLLSEEQFEIVLERERMRADRNESSFALLTFSLKKRDLAQGDLENLVRIVRRRVRFTDEIALLSRRQIAVVLTDTTQQGAEPVVADIREQHEASCGGLDVEIHVYPCARWSDTGDDRPKVRVFDEVRCIERAETFTSVQPLETVFMKRLPAWKRALDIIGAMVGLLIAAPLLLLAAVLMKLTSPGPVFFKQRRSGFGGKTFTIHKLRTMRMGADAEKAALRALSEQDGPAFKMTDDPRVTPIGRLLRKTSIDELPQLWNVLRGDMSLVGPRPLPVDEAQACQSWQQRRLDVTPGLTCTWQIEGRSRVTFAEWMRMDVQYVRSQSLLRDLKLIIQTLPAVLLRKGAV